MKIELTGAESASFAMMQIDPDVVSAFPITPQTDIMKDFAFKVMNNEVKTEFILVESEHSALSSVVGASNAGVRAMTATSSAGLAYMFEILGIASGHRLPIVMNIVNRALSGPINIHCDHSDSMAARDSGWVQFYSENAQEVYDNTIIALKLAEKINLPAMVMQDGFICSHCFQNLEVLDKKTVQKFIGEYKPKDYLLNLKKPITVGPLQLQDYNFETKIQQNEAMKTAEVEFEKIANEYYKLTKRKYDSIEAYKTSDAEYVIVALNSVCGTVKDVVDDLRKQGVKAGLLKIKLFRPFPYSKAIKALKNTKVITVLDRSLSYGANAPVFTEIKSCSSCKIHSTIYGMGGRNITKKHVEDLFDNMIKGKKQVEYVNAR